MPVAIILAGPNGAGKSTVARTLVAERLKVSVFVNADEIARGLAAYSPESVAVEAGRILLARLDDLVAQRANFAVESTLSGISLGRRIERWRVVGYAIHIIYLWVPSPEFSIARIQRRVAQGGHHIPDADVRRRYRRSIANFLRVYRPLADVWEVYDASADSGPVFAASQHEIALPRVWEAMAEGTAP